MNENGDNSGRSCVHINLYICFFFTANAIEDAYVFCCKSMCQSILYNTLNANFLPIDAISYCTSRYSTVSLPLRWAQLCFVWIFFSSSLVSFMFPFAVYASDLLARITCEPNYLKHTIKYQIPWMRSQRTTHKYKHKT